MAAGIRKAAFAAGAASMRRVHREGLREVTRAAAADCLTDGVALREKPGTKRADTWRSRKALISTTCRGVRKELPAIPALHAFVLACFSGELNAIAAEDFNTQLSCWLQLFLLVLILNRKKHTKKGYFTRVRIVSMGTL